jgi:hypothetical protein
MQRTTKNFQASSIKLGTGKIDPLSIYVRDYPPKESNKANALPTEYASHLLEGNAQCNYISENKHQYVWKQVAGSSQATTNLRAHHFTLGQDREQSMLTTTQKHYGPKISQDTGSALHSTKVNMRAHHHNFEEEPSTNYRSSYSQAYPPLPAASQFPVVLSATDICRSKIVFGNNDQPLLTTMARDYAQKQSFLRVASTPSFRPLKLGDCKQNLISTNQHYYEAYPGAGAQPFSQDKLDELRGTHFTIGTAKPVLQTEMSRAYVKFDSRRTPVKEATPCTKDLIAKGPGCYQTSYQETMKAYPFNGTSQLVPQSSRTNFVLGGSSAPLTTEFTSKSPC